MSRSFRARSVLLIAALSAAALALAGCASSDGGPEAPATVTTTANAASTPAGGSTGTATSSQSAPTKPKKPVKTVHVSSLEGDGETYGVGMPIILYFSPAPTDSTEFTKAVTVTVNGKPANGEWYWEQPLASQKKKDIIEAHYRTKRYWPKNATIQVKLPIKGLSAGKGLAYSGKLSSVTFRTGDAHITTVDGATETMTVTSNGKLVKKFKVSLGKAKTPTYNGTKIVMQKGEDAPGTDKRRPNGAVRMRGPGYDEIVDWSVRITMSGEYIHAAPWNSRIGQVSTSNGCTNMSVSDAKWYYNWARVGDVTIYSNTGGGPMPPLDGYGDWNLNWNVWKQGGLLLNH